MKKYLFGVLAIVLAVSSIAFKPRTTLTFKYNPPMSDPYSEANVQDVTKWSLGSVSCPVEDFEDRACVLQVDHTSTINDAGTQLDPAVVTINGVLGDQGNSEFKVVASGSANIFGIQNKERP